MFKLPDSIADAFIEARHSHEARRKVFAALSDGDLAASARFWMAHCTAPKMFKPGEPIYDATFWHDIVPEMLRRLDSQ